MNLKPLNDNVFLEPLEEEKVTKSGIVIPDTAEKEKPMKGRILAAGPGRIDDKGSRIPMSVKVGDLVLFKKYSETEVELESKKYLIVEEKDIIATI
ncbi:MAG: co-chaperone GroES [Candidatus Pacebacteria bacterium]|nr:co-chaperone GroES [Candidatus Paceibacterota bacterium]